MLEAEADVAVLDGDLGHVLVGDDHPAGVGLLETGDHAQQRRLTATARPEQGRERAIGHIDRNLVQRDEVAEPLGRVLNCDAH